MQDLSGQNNGFRYMLNVIDVFSKFAWSVPLKDKRGETVTEAFKLIVKSSDRLQSSYGLIKVKNFIIKIWMSG